MANLKAKTLAHMMLLSFAPLDRMARRVPLARLMEADWERAADDLWRSDRLDCFGTSDDDSEQASRIFGEATRGTLKAALRALEGSAAVTAAAILEESVWNPDLDADGVLLELARQVDAWTIVWCRKHGYRQADVDAATAIVAVERGQPELV